jgi:hypothetical protein
LLTNFEEPFKCEHPGCGKTFAISSSLTIHMVSVGSMKIRLDVLTASAANAQRREAIHLSALLEVSPESVCSGDDLTLL